MEINRLSQEELAYELEIRGLQPGKVEDMRQAYRSALKVERSGKVLILNPYPIAFEKDIVALKQKVEEVQTLLEAFNDDIDSNEYKKIVTKIEWALSRLNRSVSTEESQAREKSKVRADLILALGSLQLKAEGEDTQSDSSGESGEVSKSISCLATSRSRVALHKWDIKFSGEQGQSLNSFLERVTELAEARGVSKGQLFRSVLDLFTGRALIWYRANKSMVHSWSDHVRELRKEFLPCDYDEKLLDEIKRRTQGKDETIGTYAAIMSSMFSRLTTPLSDEQRLRILKRNISPFYQTQLGLTEVNNIQELVKLGRRLESVRTSVETFAPPPSKRNTHLLEPDLAYIASGSTSIATVGSMTPNPRSGPKCFKCGRLGHLARFCQRNFHCYGCGTRGVTRPNCTNCRGSRENQPNQNTTNTKSNQIAGNENRARQ